MSSLNETECSFAVYHQIKALKLWFRARLRTVWWTKEMEMKKKMNKIPNIYLWRHNQINYGFSKKDYIPSQLGTMFCTRI